MALVRKAVLATAMLGTGLVSMSGMAFATDSSGSSDSSGGTTVQEGLINLSDTSPNTALNLCNNDVPVDVLGVQVPVQDLAGSAPVLSGTEIPVVSDLLGLDGQAGNGGTGKNVKSCASGIDARN